jgi:hypothetical protein
VDFLPPNLTVSLDISDNPLVIKAAKVLSPKFNPLTIPEQKAIIFFNAPPHFCSFYIIRSIYS